MKSDAIAERKTRLLLEGGRCRVGLMQSKTALMEELSGRTLMRSAVHSLITRHGGALLIPGMRALRIAVPAAASWVVRRQLRRPLMVAASLSSLLLLWARSRKQSSDQGH